MDGESQGLEFKNRFRNIAETVLREDSPKLSESNVGFELIDKVDDGNRAVGAIALRVGDKWAYVPVFWFDGDLKGTEMMYVKQWDKFVPTRDSWIRALKNNSLDEWVKLAPPGYRNGTRADQASFLNTFTSKYSSAAAGIANLPTTGEVDPGDILETFLVVAREEPSEKVAAAVAADILALEEAADQRIASLLCDEVLPSIEKRAGKLRTGGLRVLTDIRDPDVQKLSDSERKAMMGNGFFVVDDRKNSAQVIIRKTTEALQLRIPSGKDGLYTLIDSDGKPVDAMVFKKPTRGQFGAGPLDGTPDSGSADACCAPCPDYRGTSISSTPLAVAWVSPKQVLEQASAKMLVVPLEGDGRYCEIASSKLLGMPMSATGADASEPGREATVGNMASLARALRSRNGNTSPSKQNPAVWNNFLLLHDDIEPVEFVITESTGSGSDVAFKGRVSGRDVHVVFVDDSVTPGVRGNSLVVTPDCRILIQDQRLFSPGSQEAVLEMLFDKQRPAELSIFADAGHGYKVQAKLPSSSELAKGLDGSQFKEDLWSKTASFEQSFSNKLAAMMFLAEGFGINAGTAGNMLSEAKQRQHKGSADYMVKTAQVAPNVNEQYSTTQGMPGAATAMKDLDRLNNQRNVPGNLKGEGRDTLRRLLDTSSLEDIVFHKDVARINRKLFAELMESMDIKARLLCTVYWHRDQFEEKFGDDLDKLENQLKSSFLDDGDLLIFLQEKGSDAGGFNDATRGSLGANLGAN